MLNKSYKGKIMTTKKIILSLITIAALSSTATANESVSEQLQMLKEQIAKLEKQLNEQNKKVEKQLLQNSKKITKVEKKVTKTTKKLNQVKAHDAGDNIKWDVDFRTQYDGINYELGNGTKLRNTSLYSNRLWLGMKFQADENTLFRGILGYNKVWGDNRADIITQGGVGNNSGFDWVTNEAATNDNSLKVKEAFWLYMSDSFFGNTDIPWTASAGRRPSTDGLGIALRVDQQAKSPIAHNINVEFDGASLKFDLDKITSINGMWLKFCVGRGLTNAKLRFSSDGQDYIANDNTTQNVDMAGFIASLYDDGQYSVTMNYAKAWNLIGNRERDNVQGADDNGKFFEFGDIEYFTAMLKVDGIGEGISDFLDDSVFFASYAQSKTSPNSGDLMLGSTQGETGRSYWIGVNMPDGFSDGRFGLEWNRGTKYWRAMTYGEDTMIGSKLAARGTAWEIYYNKPITKALDSSFRFTQIDYDYTGSNGFFGDFGTPHDINSANGAQAVKSAQNFTANIRYRF